jgi:hypothetical protein
MLTSLAIYSSHLDIEIHPRDQYLSDFGVISLSQIICCCARAEIELQNQPLWTTIAIDRVSNIFQIFLRFQNNKQVFCRDKCTIQIYQTKLGFAFRTLARKLPPIWTSPHSRLLVVWHQPIPLIGNHASMQSRRDICYGILGVPCSVFEVESLRWDRILSSACPGNIHLFEDTTPLKIATRCYCMRYKNE